METLMSAVIGALSGKASREMIVFIISMIPILELRGALLVAGPVLDYTHFQLAETDEDLPPHGGKDGKPGA